MMLIFPLVYLSSLIYAMKNIFSKQYDAILVFFVVGLPIYITTLSVLDLYELDILIPFVQYTKEVIVVVTLSLLVYQMNERPRFTLLDKLVAGYLIYNAIYVILPLGSYGMFQKIVAFKNIAFFPLIYFIGKLIDPKKVWLSKYQLLICLLAIIAASVLLFETISDTHLQTLTGYAGYNFKYLGVEPAGNFGLTWTFEIEGGIKRFASIFANPLEHAAATLLTIAVLVSLITKKEISNKKIFIIAAFAAILSVIFALSRASLISFGLVLYIYAIVTKRKKILLAFHVLFATGALSLVYLLSNNTISEFIINTFNFTNSSSISHVIEWVNGIQSIYAHPLGIGMGESGRIAGELGLNTGGENQLIIIAVQTGLVSLILYVAILFISIKWSAILFTKTSGKSKQMGTLLFIFKIGMIIPMLTAAVESYLYISYVGWFLTGILSTTYDSVILKKNDVELQ
jgi:hypothetical protein